MRTFARILGRLFVVGLSYVVACVAAGLTVAGSYVLRAFLEQGIGTAGDRLLVETLYVGGLVASFVAVYAFAPSVIAIVVGEVFSIRRAMYYVVCGGVAGAIAFAAFMNQGDTAVPVDGRMVMFAASGLVAGFVYWLLGGRSAGVLDRPAA